MPAETVLAFDFGLKRIGVAVGNSITVGAEPLQTLRAETDDDRFARIAALLKQWAPARLVVGRPTHPDGAAHAMTVRCDRFARQLEGRFGLPVALVDERYSSVDAEDSQRADRTPDRRARRGARGRDVPAGAARSADPEGRLDAEAAAIILRQYWAEQGRT